MTMRTALCGACAAATLLAPVTLAQTAGPTALTSAQRWSEEVWSSAMRGDDQALQDHLASVPSDNVSPKGAGRVIQTLQQLRDNQSRIESQRNEAREQSLVKLREQVAGGELEKALATAVELQTRTIDFDEVFALQEVKELIEWASAQLPGVLEQSDWLYAQRLLFLLRTLHEDTDLRDEYRAFDRDLDRVNQRVALLARYAPHRLHELRQKRAERLGEDPLGEFDAANAVDWNERLDGVSSRMLRAALNRAALDHVERAGWRPMLIGGLESMRLLATTDALAETFPKLADAGRVARWTATIDRELAALEKTPDRELTHWRCGDIVDALIAANADTIELPEGVIHREFGDGAIFNLDRYTEVIWPDKLRRFNQATLGNFVGVGIIIRHNEAHEIVVANPLEGTPAYFGGVKPDDIIVSVEGESTVGWSLNDAVDHITGPEHTNVTLGLKRAGHEGPLELTLERRVIKIHSVKGWWKEGLTDDGDPVWDWMIDPDSRIAYVQLTQFTEDTYGDLLTAWGEITREADGPPAGLILDLRFNPGGLLTSAVEISNLFVGSGVIVSGEDKDGNRAWPDQQADPRLDVFADTGVPTVVLINKGSASASEIVSGCLQAHDAAVVVGERSFGKGSVQTVHSITHDSKLKLTTHYYRLPSADGKKSGRFVHRRDGAGEEEEWGVIPDITIKMSDHQVADSIDLRQKSDLIPEDETGRPNPQSPDRPDIRRLLTEGIDPQLETALLLLQARLLGSLPADEAEATRISANS